MIFSFDVSVSDHDLLKRGVLAGRLHGSPNTWHRIVVEAHNEAEAALLAAQMAGCHAIPTEVVLRI